MNISIAANWVKYAGLLVFAVGFAILFQWYDQAALVGAIMAAIGAVAAIAGYKTQQIVALRHG
jgi:hypothetical protein